VAASERAVDPASLHQAGEPAPSRPHSTAHPLTVTRYDHELHAMVRHVYGYSWSCDCGASGERFETMNGARQGKREHEATHQR